VALGIDGQAQDSFQAAGTHLAGVGKVTILVSQRVWDGQMGWVTKGRQAHNYWQQHVRMASCACVKQAARRECGSC
jgi:hypothetical protein